MDDINGQTSCPQIKSDSRSDLSTDLPGQDSCQPVRQCMDDSSGGPEQSQLESDSGEERREFYVYCLRRPDKEDMLWPGADQPFYVGKGRVNNGRIKDHRREAEQLRHKPGPKSLKINIIHKLWKNELDFTEEIILGGLTEREAFELEITTIELYGRINLGTGCLANLTDGGEGGYGKIISEETREKLRQLATGRTPSEETRQKLIESHKGKVHLEETKRKMSKAHKGKPKSEEHRQKMIGHSTSDETKHKIGDSNRGKEPWLKGKHHTDEAKEKLRQAHLGKKASPETKQKLKDAWKTRAFSEETEKLRREKIGKANLGRIVTKETRDKIGKANKGKRTGVAMPDETKRKISKSNMGKKKSGDHSGDKNPFFGKKHSPETRQKMKEAWARRKKNKDGE